MKAKYTQSVLGTGNPYVEALPRRMSVPELYVALEGAVRRGKNDTKLPAEERLTLTARIFDVHLPMQSSAIIYNLLYQAILSSYAWEDTDAVRQTVLLKQYQDSKGELGKMRRTAQAKSYSVLGVPGIGKSTTIARILRTFPQVIEHTNYRGRPLCCKQIVYVSIQCPADCSVKSACAAILAEIDKATGTQYLSDATRRRPLTLDALIMQISILCLTFHIGVIVVDEVQNLMRSSVTGSISGRLIGFFVQLMNDTGVGVVLVGTPEAQRLFDSEEHLARRTRGLTLMPLAYGETFDALLNVLWEQQYVQRFTPLTDRLSRMLYEISSGIPALLAQTLFFAQQYAITMGKEELSEATIRDTTAMYNLRKPSRSGKDASLKAVKCGADTKEKTEKAESAVDTCSGSRRLNKAKGRPLGFVSDEDILSLCAACSSAEEVRKLLETHKWIEK